MTPAAVSVAMAVGVVATLCTAAGLAGCSTDPVPGGPLSAPPPHGWSTTQAVGEPFTDGLEVLYLRGNQPAKVTSVSLLGADGIELLGAKLATPTREVASIQKLAWPPRSRALPEVVDAVGATLTTRHVDPKGWLLLLGMRVTGPGYHVRHGVRIEYEVDGERHVRDLGAELAVCTSADLEVDGSCPFPQDAPG